ncbi:MAG: MMPL family transporter [Deltaproteobacteria bacterium]|nr:MMPL family transporter [Deltaproteobacteria bacterium]
MARPFSERDGTRGRIVYITPTDPKLIDDAHYLFRWADSYRRTELPDGSVVLGSGRAVIYADIWEAVVEDVPKAVIVALLATLVVVALAFRRLFPAMAVMVALVAGIAWMTGLLAAGGVRLNSLNFIALPITFGIGVDYAVNVMQRYRREGVGGALNAVRETGGAVILCSFTTTFGYLALVGSVNNAVRSLGVAAVLGEVACLLAAVIVLPAALMWRDGSRSRQPASKRDGGDGPPSSGSLAESKR